MVAVFPKRGQARDRYDRPATDGLKAFAQLSDPERSCRCLHREVDYIHV